jgi:hypothetical protein
MSRNPWITPAQHARVLELLATGLSQQSVAERVDLSQGAVSQIARGRGAYQPKQPGRRKVKGGSVVSAAAPVEKPRPSVASESSRTDDAPPHTAAAVCEAPDSGPTLLAVEAEPSCSCGDNIADARRTPPSSDPRAYANAYYARNIERRRMQAVEYRERKRKRLAAAKRRTFTREEALYRAKCQRAGFDPDTGKMR